MHSLFVEVLTCLYLMNHLSLKQTDDGNDILDANHMTHSYRVFLCAFSMSRMYLSIRAKNNTVIGMQEKDTCKFHENKNQRYSKYILF